MLDDDDVWEPLEDALGALGDLSRPYHYKHRFDPDYFQWAVFGTRVKVNRRSRREYAARRAAEAEALRQERLNPKPKTTRRGRPRTSQPRSGAPETIAG